MAPSVCFTSTSGTTAPEPEKMDVFYLTSPSTAPPYGSVVHEGPPALLGRRRHRTAWMCATTSLVIGAILLVRPSLLSHLLVVCACRTVGKQSAGGTGVGAEMEAHWIRSEEDGNHSSLPNGNWLVSSILVQSEDSVSSGRNDVFVLQYLSSLTLSPPRQNA